MTSPKPFNWDDINSNRVEDIRREGRSLGIIFPPNTKKSKMIELLLLQKTGHDQSLNTFQQSMSATNSPNITNAPNPKPISKTPVVSKKAKTNKPKAANDTYINPLLLGDESLRKSPKQSPTLSNLPKKSPKAEKSSKKSQKKNKEDELEVTNKFQLPPPPPQEIRQPSPVRHSSPVKHSSPHERTPTPERDPLSSWSPTPQQNSYSSGYPTRSPSPHRSRKHNKVEYEGSQSGPLLQVYRYFPIILVILFICSILDPHVSGLFVIALIFYIYLWYKYGKKSNKNITDFSGHRHHHHHHK